MDLLEVLRRKVAVLADQQTSGGMSAVLRHIETAERHLLRAESEGDSEAYNDAIYRTNQAFEGMLKEALSVLAQLDASELSPYAIEKRLVDDRVLTDRVLEQFTNYRRRWRNPSTHDHRLFFDQHEAFLALTTISAFANILLDQMIEAVSRRRASEATDPRRDEIRGAMEAYDSCPLLDRTTALLRQFTRLLRAMPERRSRTEVEIIGLLNGFASSVEPDLILRREVVAGTARPDFLVRDDSDALVLEVKVWRGQHYLREALNQVAFYLSAASIRQAIVYFAPGVSETTEYDEISWDCEPLFVEEGKMVRVLGPSVLLQAMERDDRDERA